MEEQFRKMKRGPLSLVKGIQANIPKEKGGRWCITCWASSQGGWVCGMTWSGKSLLEFGSDHMGVLPWERWACGTSMRQMLKRATRIVVDQGKFRTEVKTTLSGAFDLWVAFGFLDWPD